MRPGSAEVRWGGGDLTGVLVTEVSEFPRAVAGQSPGLEQRVWCGSHPSLSSLNQDAPAFYTVFSVNIGENSEPRNLRQSN